MSTREKIEKLERRLKDRPGIARRIVYVRPGEPDPVDVPAGTLVMRTRIVTTTKEGTNEQPGNRPAA